MLVKGVMTQMSGSLGGITAGHAQGGIYLRARAIPVNPSSTYQAQIRSAMTAMATRWTQTLTAAQREAWALYGANVATTNRLGDVIFLSGQQWYIACNVPRVGGDAKISGISTPIVDDAPTTFDRGDPGALGITTLGEAGGLALAIGGAPAWAAIDDAYILVYQGKPISAGRNFFAGPYRLVTIEPGDSVTPLTSITVPAAAFTAAGWTITEGQRCAFAAAVTYPDGRLTSRVRLGPEDVAA